MRLLSIKRFSAGVFAIATLSISSLVLAKWLPVHQIASEKPLAVVDGSTGKSYTPSYGRSSSNWQATTSQAFSHAIAVTPGGLYEFRMVQPKTTDDASIYGLWDVYRDGLLVCDDCVGKAYGLDGAVGNYFKIYVGTPARYAELWHFSAQITGRFDY